MAVTGYTCYATYYQLAQQLDDDEQRGIFWCAVNDYMFANVDREDEIEDKVTRMAFIYAKSHLKHSLAQSVRKQEKTKTKPKRNQKKTERKPNQNQDETEAEQYQGQGQDKGQVQDDDGNHSHGSQSSSSYAAVACGENAAPTPYDGRESVVFPCPYCHAETVGEWSESVGKYSVNCKGCGGSYVMSADAVKLSILKGAAS